MRFGASSAAASGGSCGARVTANSNATSRSSNSSVSTLPSTRRASGERRGILARLNHPHVVTVYDYREDGELRLLVMEYLPGGTFADRRRAGMSVETAIAAALATASGLQYVHEHGVLHRDVKPENLMFDASGTLKVTDFGIARGELVDATVINLTSAGQLFGTPAYVSPEQAQLAITDARPEIGAASDQYSLAAVLYETLSGHLTHDASGGALALLKRRIEEPAQPLRRTVPALPRAIDDVVLTALARQPNDRYPSIEAFAVALGDATAHTLGSDWLSRSEVQLRDAGPIRDAARAGSADA